LSGGKSGVAVRGCSYAFGSGGWLGGQVGFGFGFGFGFGWGDFGFEAEESIEGVHDRFVLFLAERSMARFAARSLEVGAFVVVLAGVEGLGVAAGAFAHGRGNEAAELVEEFGFLFEGKIGLGGFEEGFEELEGKEGFGREMEGRDG